MTDPITTPQAAAIIGVSRPRIHQLITRGELPAVKIGRSWLVERAAAENFVRKPVGNFTGRPRTKRKA
jgi:excisionase family DNA binding protein